MVKRDYYSRGKMPVPSGMIQSTEEQIRIEETHRKEQNKKGDVGIEKNRTAQKRSEWDGTEYKSIH